MAEKTGTDLQELRALLAEVRALREDVERKSAELRSCGGSARESKATPRVFNLSRYLALRDHDLTELQCRLAARGLSSLGRSESHVELALDTLIATLRRLSGEPGAPYPPWHWRGRARQNWRRRPIGCLANGGQRPARSGDGDVAAGSGDGPRLRRALW